MPHILGRGGAIHNHPSWLSLLPEPRESGCMHWHPEPKDDSWKQAHLAMVEGLGKRLWLSCDWCQHSVMADVRAFAERHHLDLLTPLLTISRVLKCTRCGERKARCRLEPHGYSR